MAINLYDAQLDAIEKMKKGSILNGNVGSGKSITAIAYYYLQNGGEISTLRGYTEEEKENLNKNLQTTKN